MSSYATDSFIFNESTKSATVQEPFDNRQYIKIHDMNNGVYSGNDIRFETSGVSQTSAFSDYSRGLIHIPLCVGVYAAGVTFTAADLKESDMMLCVKNSFTTLIDRLSVKVDGVELVQQCNNINEIISYNMNTTMTDFEETVWGDVLNYAIDDGMVYNGAPSLSGQGYCSNNNSLVKESGCRNLEYGKTLTFNSGAYKRSERFTNVSGTVKTVFTDKTFSDLMEDTVENGDTWKKYYINAIIRLKDLPFFNDMPLSKGSLLQITLYVNQGSFTVNKAATTGNLTCTAVRSSGSTNPIMFNAGWVVMEGQVAATALTTAPAGINTLAADITAADVIGNRAVPCGSANLSLDKSYEVSWGVARCTLNSGAISIAHPLQTCRLLIPQYNLNPTFDQSYTLLRNKKHIYHDYVLSTIDVSANQSINKYVTSKARITRIIIIPKLSAAAHNAGIAMDPSLSPFSSCPATPSPLLAALITNLNLEVGGVNVWRENMQYSYEHWLQEQMHSSNNGGFSNLASGRITKTMYDNLHGVIVCNVRRNDITRNSELKVQISLTSMCRMAIQLDVFVEYERSCMIDLITGKIYDIV